MLSNLVVLVAICFLLPGSEATTSQNGSLNTGGIPGLLPNCKANKYQCEQGACIHPTFVCDGILDCPLGDDEMECLSVPNRRCTRHQRKCKSTDACIPKIWFCDGQHDCDDDSDEVNCPDYPWKERFKPSRSQTTTTTTPLPNRTRNCEDMYQCKQGKCIHPTFVCDGDQDCPLGDDEKGCPSASKTRCIAPQRKCRTTEACLPINWFCDGEPDCEDNSDEENCTNISEAKEMMGLPDREINPTLNQTPLTNTTVAATRFRASCAKDEYRCRRGECIDASKLCDGNQDCADGDDESGDCGDCHQMGCKYGCKATNKEASCTCPEGTITNPNDYLDCVVETCDFGFVSHSKQYRCLPRNDSIGGDLFVAFRNKIHKLSLPVNPSSAQYGIDSQLDSGENLYHLAIDVQNNHLWTGVPSEKNEWCIAMSKGDKIHFRRCGFAELEAMQYDWINHNLYFITGGKSEVAWIRVCTADLMYCTKLVQGRQPETIARRQHIQAFKGLALHPARGLMCWAEIFRRQSKIKCANMDGSKIDLLSNHKLINPIALVWDTSKNDLYIADARTKQIERINYDTRFMTRAIGIMTRVIGRMDDPYALAFFHGILYYTDKELNLIRWINVSTADHHLMPDSALILPHKPFGLAINHSQNEQAIPPCPDSFDCNYVCVTLPNGESLHKCLCPEGYHRNEQDKTCSFQADNHNFQNSSYLEINYMEELCESKAACGDNGECVHSIDPETELVDTITCQCNVGYSGIACELKAVEKTTFLTIILVVIVFFIILVIALACIYQKHQAFRNLTRSMKTAVVTNLPSNSRSRQDSCTAPIFSDLKRSEDSDKPRNDVETGSLLELNKTQ